MKYRLLHFLTVALVLAMALPLCWTPVFPDWMTGRPDANVRLIAAMANRNFTAFEAALADGASLTDDGALNTFPLSSAAGVGELEMVRRLIAAGANLDAVDRRGTTALMAAAGRDHAEVVELLLRSGASLSCRDNSDCTALDWANDSDATRAAHMLRRAASDRLDVNGAESGTGTESATGLTYDD